MDAIIEFRDVGICRGARKILDGLNLKIAAGESFSLVGRNGSGKSSILKTLVGLIEIDKGSVFLCGEPLSNWTVTRRAQLIGYVPQLIEPTIAISSKEFVMMSRLCCTGFRQYSKEDLKHAEEALEFFGARSLESSTFQSLSGGERQRVLLAAAIAHKPKILLLDEPGAFLDPLAQQEIADCLCLLTKEGSYTLLGVTHDLERAEFWAKKTIGLQHGRVVFDGISEQLRKPEVFQKIFQNEEEAISRGIN